MATTKFLAFDFGAESGRAIVGILRDDSIVLEEVHRFPNTQIETGGHRHWDFPYLLNELKNGLSLAVRHGHADIASIGIDTWGVDFGLIGNDGTLLEPPYAYRDSRTDGMMEKVFEKIPRAEIYRRTGIQFMQINSLYQLAAAAEHNAGLAGKCKALLFMPDLFNYFCTGTLCSEYTIASTSQMLNAATQEWDEAIFSRAGLPRTIMQPIVRPGTIIGPLLPGIAGAAGFTRPVSVVAVGSHDTASAVAAIPALDDDWGFLSSGTWSVIGIESCCPFTTEEAMSCDFTNEGGIGGTIRFLQNVMGMWLLQECRKSWARSGRTYTYDELMLGASEASGFAAYIDPLDASYLNPPDMPEAIRAYCRRTHQPFPESPAGFARCIFESLAMTYRDVLEKIACVTGAPVRTLHIVGGGSKNSLLNQLTADATGVRVVAGPVEAAALGNILVQAVACGFLASIRDGRECIARTFRPAVSTPRNRQEWDAQYRHFQSIK